MTRERDLLSFGLPVGATESAGNFADAPWRLCHTGNLPATCVT